MLSGQEYETTHNRMELLAVIKAIEFIDALGLQKNTIEICSDSQYVVNLPGRRENLNQKNFMTHKGTVIRNADLIKILLRQLEEHSVLFTKIKAHQKNGNKINREVDLLVRNIVRKNTFTHG